MGATVTRNVQLTEDNVGLITRSGKVVAGPELPKNPEPKVPIADEIRQVVKTIKVSDYDIIEQLKRQPAQISLFDLINSSDKHRNSLERFLAEVHVPPEIEDNAFDIFMNGMLAQNPITFSDQDVPKGAEESNKALFITLSCMGNQISKVLIDGGSGVNILPLGVARQLGLDVKNMSPPSLNIRAFDGAKRKPLGEIILEIIMGPAKFMTAFQVLETNSSFNMLLGRPWIHQAGAIPSTYHQNVKFPFGGKLVTVNGERDIELCNEVDIPYVGEPSVEPSTMQAFEMVNMIRKVNNDPPIEPVVANMARVLLQMGYQIGGGLGARGQGMLFPIQIPMPADKAGIR
ncbi:hypothetical protein MLD38_037869 [Melastoma candidum]|uniref:Uncharacterized protein n=1 Tax=Melastoma candidum TaxID=119954 RepID=A0ACB9LNC7_9MYRT|nr:hypothetical protein MLD38_037869 [Melastoma candidum]